MAANCDAPGFAQAAAVNASTLKTLSWAPFRRAEFGWETYVPLIQREIRTACPPASSGFAKALSAWRSRQGLPPSGVMDAAGFVRMKGRWQEIRPFVTAAGRGACPSPPEPSALASVATAESYGGKAIQLRAGALRAHRRMVSAARAESAEIGADPRNLTIFSGYRSPEYDAARCVRDGNCDGISRATCSPHRTGLAMDLYVGQAPGFGPDSSADANRRFQSQTVAYAWLVANAGRFGFVNYPFEPWHWEWTGEAP